MSKVRKIGRIFGLPLAAHDLDDFGRPGFDFAAEHLARAAVDGNIIAFPDRRAADGERLLFFVQTEGSAAHDGGLSHLAADDRGMRGHAAGGRQDALGGAHAVDVIGRSLRPDQDDLFPFLFPDLGLLCRENGLTGGRAGGSSQPFGQDLVLLFLRGIEDRMEELVEGLRLDLEERLLLAGQPFLDQVDGDLTAAWPVRLPFRVWSM